MSAQDGGPDISESDDIIIDLLGWVKTHRMQTVDRSGLIGKSINRAEAWLKERARQ